MTKKEIKKNIKISKEGLKKFQSFKATDEIDAENNSINIEAFKEEIERLENML